MQTLMVGATLQGGKYIIKKVLGQGGFGITYLAEHDLMGTEVAIKEFFMKDFCNREEFTSSVSVGTAGSKDLVDRFRAKFLKEARNIARMHHPNIIRISDVFEENGTSYFAMDYCAGGSLADLVKSNPSGVEESVALQYIRQVASALQYIHVRNMNHLDVKPSNILLDAGGNAILIDFGLSKQYDDIGSQTSTTPVGISHGYAPIEQYKQGGISEFSPATDIYSLGATLYKLITGQTPPDAQALLEDELPTITASASVVAAIRTALQPRRKDRSQSVDAWLEIIDKQENEPQLEENTDIEKTSSIAETIDTEATIVIEPSNQERMEEELRATQEKVETERRIKEQEEQDRKRAEAEAARLAAKRHAEEVERLSIEAEKRRIAEELRLERIRREQEKETERTRSSYVGKFLLLLVCVLFFSFLYAVIANMSKTQHPDQSPVAQSLNTQQPISNYELALQYWEQKEDVKAVEYLEKAREEGIADAIDMLAWCYEFGHGVEKDETQAFDLYHEAFESGSVDALYRLGICYIEGVGTSINKKQGFECFQKAVSLQNDFAEAIYALAFCYAYGEGVGRDLNKAKAIVSHPSLSDVENAKELILYIDKELSDLNTENSDGNSARFTVRKTDIQQKDRHAEENNKKKISKQTDVSFVGTPERVYIKVDGVDYGGNYFPISLSPGQHNVVIYSGGYENKETTITVPDNGKYEYRYSLLPVITVRGVVMDSRGLPLQGCTITAKQSNRSAIVGSNGIFEIKGVLLDDQIVLIYNNKTYSQSAKSTINFTIPVDSEIQTITVKGMVVDKKGEPIIGANVKIVGTNSGTISDIDGHFILKDVPSDASLSVSFVGLKTAVVKASSNVYVQLKKK